MNQYQIRASSYAVAGACALVLLILLGWLALREPTVPVDERPAKVATSPLRARYVNPLLDAEDDRQGDTPTNQVVLSATTNSNAAVLYRQAFALLDSLSKEQKELIKDWRTNVDQSVTAELCEKIRPIADLMHQAATVSNCDWGLDEPITFSTKEPHLAQSRGLARAAIWGAAHCRSDDSMGAVDDLVATAQLGQNLSPTLIAHLVDLAIQGLAIDFITELADTLAGTGDTRLTQLFDDTHYDESLSRAIGVDADMLDREADKWAVMPPEELARELKQLGDDNTAFQSMEPAHVVAEMRQATELERELANALLLSEAEYRDALARVLAAEKTNPFAEMFLSNEDRLVDKTQAMTVRSAMTAAGLTVMQSGPGVLQSHLDPTTGRPFTYTQTTEGFELQSNYQVNGQPLKLQFK